METTTYKAYAIRYGSARDRLSEQNFMHPPARGVNMPLDYYVWVLQGDDRTVLVDAGFTPETGRRRDRPVDGDLIDLLADAGFAPEDVSDVILSHLHFDHTGFVDRFPHARIHLQQVELESAVTGVARHASVRWTYEPHDIRAVVSACFEGRVTLHSGDAALFPGVRILHLPGHAPGQCAIGVETERGEIILAVDVAHYFANLLLEQPFSLTEDYRQTLQSYQRLRAIQPDIDRIIVGHDPKVRTLYPPERRGRADLHPLHLPPARYEPGWLARLDDYAAD